jgi:CubicO group peptidase (beta-lactamase class C family)
MRTNEIARFNTKFIDSTSRSDLGYHSGPDTVMRTRALKQIPAGLALSALLLAPLLGVQSTTRLPADSEIRQILVDRVDRYRQSVGIVVGVVEPGGRRVITHGHLAANDSRPLNGDTVFEIGSITKVFTALLLTDMVERGEVELTDPVAAHLPSTVKVPQRNGEQITLRDLAMHLSSLPRMPSNVESTDASNPFANYSVDRLFAFLSGYELPRDIGSRFEYSNIGGALLAHALARRSGLDYAALLEARIAGPLGLRSTRVDMNPEMKSRLAVGHAYGLTPTPNWELGALAGAGALHSTANDLLTFLAAHLGYTKTPLAPAMGTMLRFRRSMGQGEVGLAWFSRVDDGVEIISHEGSTGGYRAFIGYDPKARVGVVVLSNTGTGAGIYDIGIHLLNPSTPLLSADELKPPKVRTEIAVDMGLLDRYTGRYQFPSRQMARVTREGDHLLLQGEGDVKIAFFAESSRDFFAKIMDAQITFESDTQGNITGLLFHRSGAVQQVKRSD